MKKENLSKFIIGVGLIVVSLLCGILIERNLNEESYKEETYRVEIIEDQTKNDPTLYVENDLESIYLIGLSNIFVDKKELQEDYDSEFLSNLINEMNYVEEHQDYTVYRDLQHVSEYGFSLVKCNENNKIYIGPMNMVFSDNLCEIENPKEGNTFIKTYKVLNVEDSNDYDYLYLTLRQYQCEEVVTVRVKRKLCPDIKANSNYEFTFEYTSNMVEENINSVFSNTNLLKITLTDKEGMDQIQDGV